MRGRAADSYVDRIHIGHAIPVGRPADAGTVIVPGWSDPDQVASPELIEALRAAHARGARVVSLCTGAFVLADAGLLYGRRATTHWMYAQRLRVRSPHTDVDDRVLFVEDDGIFTSAGTAAGIDMCMHLVRIDYGSAAANAVARRNRDATFSRGWSGPVRRAAGPPRPLPSRAGRRILADAARRS
jgi:transcriptional regulator GlxA family with amidase domain